jgi:hypothetical protein
MILNRSLTVLGVAALALGVTAAAGPAFASAASTAHANPGGLFHAAPGGLHANATRGTGDKPVLDYSTNWSGYAVTGGTFTSASATWVQNAGVCTSGDGNTDMSPWVGIDGFTSSSVEQIGTSVDCSGASADYYAWYEMYPANFVTINKTIKAGDSFTGSVTRSGSTYTLKLVNNTEGWTYSINKSASDKNSSAEAVMEQAGDHLTKWNGTDPFTSFLVNGSPVGSFTASTYTIYQMEIQNGSTLCDSTSALSSNENFTETWLNAC